MKVFSIVWQYRHPSWSNSWRDFTAEVQQIVEEAYLNGEHQVQTTLECGATIRINLDAMVQYSETNNVTRDVRRLYHAAPSVR